ncbi:hypothetical protein PflSS101_1674 [Pseudomonas lactis]|uniref:Uncharacterized protein n=1 Tax=Pseudomonas lactis TaxID=1615674 RepID=I4K4Y1_9PSED|nr:hypothetical protein PflSS101_1674 [Pseudomonas lactis]
MKRWQGDAVGGIAGHCLVGSHHTAAFRRFRPALEYSLKEDEKSWSFTLPWRTGLIVGLVFAVALSQFFSATPSQFMYLTFDGYVSENSVCLHRQCFGYDYFLVCGLDCIVLLSAGNAPQSVSIGPERWLRKNCRM